MKRLVCLLFFLCLSLVSAFVSSDMLVQDNAEVLSFDDEVVLREMFRIVEENTTAELVFVSLSSVDDDISVVATRMGQEVGVGKADKDNGMVILYVKDINKLWVATGYGVEGVFPDAKIGRFLDEYYVPSRNSGDVAGGILNFSFAISGELIINGDELRSSSVQRDYSWLFILIVFIIIFIVLSRMRAFRHGFLPVFVPGTFSRGSSGGFGGSSGGGFGGGSFGGGGAGR